MIKYGRGLPGGTDTRIEGSSVCLGGWLLWVVISATEDTKQGKSVGRKTVFGVTIALDTDSQVTSLIQRKDLKELRE